MFHFFGKVKEIFKNGKCQILKIARSGYIFILENLSKEPRTSSQAPTLSQNYVRSVCHTAH